MASISNVSETKYYLIPSLFLTLIFLNLLQFNGLKVVVFLFFAFSSFYIKGENSGEYSHGKNILVPSKFFELSHSGFIENKGQFIDQNNQPNPGVLYLLNAPGFNVQLRSNGWSYDLYTLSHEDRSKRHGWELRDSVFRVQNSEQQVTNLEFNRIDFDIIGLNPDYEIITSAPSSDYLNYYTTGTPVEGIKSVWSFQQVTYKNIYPYIDLEFMIDEESGIKYNFIIHPEGNIEDIKFKIYGAEIENKQNSALLLKTEIGTVEESIPKSFAQENGIYTPIKIRFNRIEGNQFGFRIDCQTHSETTLVIDPTPRRIWSTYYGGSIYEIGGGCTIDQLGYIYVAGYTTSPDNIATIGSYQSMLQGNTDAFLVKFNPNGQRIWGTYYGGVNEETLYGCTIDHSNKIYISGRTLSTTNISTPGSHQQTLGGAIDCYLAKFSASGQLLWATYYGGSGPEYFTNCNVDGINNVYLAGTTASNNNISTPGSHQPFPGGSNDAFLTKFDSNGIRLWSTYYGGSSEDWGFGCSVGKNGDIFLTGLTTSANNISTAGSHQPLYAGMGDAFLAKFNSNGARLWGTYYGGLITDEAHECVTDTNDNIYIAGHTMSVENISTPGCHQFIYGGDGDAFLTKFDSDGTRVWGTYYGGNLSEQSDFRPVSIDIHGDVYLIGGSDSFTNIASLNSYQTIKAGDRDAFLAKFDPAGQRLWGTYYGDTAVDVGVACTVDPCGHQYFLGVTGSLNNIATLGSHQFFFGGGSTDAFLVKFADCTPPDTAGQITGSDSVCVSATGVLYWVHEIAFATGYSWSVPAGCTITSGQNTDTIYVTFDTNAVSGTISVYGTSCCEDGVPSYSNVSVFSRPIPPISGPDTSCTGIPTVYYTDPNQVFYQWSISTGGSVLNGGEISDSTITILWTTTGSNWIQVNYSDSSGCNALIPSLKNVWIESGDTVALSISWLNDTICYGEQVSFTASSLNTGANPLFQWFINGTDTNHNDSVLSYLPTQDDTVFCVVTSFEPCRSNNPDTSNILIIHVLPALPVSIGIMASENPVCEGDTVTIIGVSINGGSLPVYQWFVNGSPAGTNDSIFAYTPSNGDQVFCVLTSSELCTANNPATSDTINMIVNPLVPAGISISASANPVCEGLPISFTATPVNGGTIPSYQWQVNGINTGTNNPGFTYTPVDGDLVTCTLTSNAECVTNNPAISNSITMSVGEAPDVSFAVCFDTITTLNAKPFKLKGGIPLGGTYSGPGVDQITGYFNPAMAGVGLKTISYSYTNLFNCSNNATRAISVINPAPLSCGDSLTDIRDNRKYPTIQIGSQCWLAVNLNHGQQIGGSSAQRDNCLVEKYCYNDLPSNCTQYGALYQWDELMRYEDVEEIQGLCPTGWHVPSEADWDQLFAVYQGNAFAGSPLLYTGYSGFNVLLAGVEFFNQSHQFADLASIMWSSTSHGQYKAWSHGLNDYNYSVSYYPSYRSNAFSTRCLRD